MIAGVFSPFYKPPSTPLMLDFFSKVIGVSYRSCLEFSNRMEDPMSTLLGLSMTASVASAGAC